MRLFAPAGHQLGQLRLPSILFGLVLAVSTIALGAAHAEKLVYQADGYAVTEYHLDNGLQLVVIPDRRAPVVTHMVWYKVGSADESRGKSGIAHYLEHLMFKDTLNTPAGEFSEKIAEIGGQENAFTTTDFTAYFQKIGPKALEMVMGYEADRMANLILNEENVRAELDVVLQERRSRVDDNPGGRLSEAVQASLYLNHPYGVPIIGWEHELRTLSHVDALEFYDRYYTPNNAVVVVAGDVDPDPVYALAKTYYGVLKRRAEPGPRVRATEPEPIAARTVELRDGRITVPSLRRVYLMPSYFSSDPKQAAALDILAYVLGGSTSSRIYRQLIVERKVAASAGSYYSGSSIDQTRFGFYGTPARGVSLQELEAAIEEVIADLLDGGVSAEEVQRARHSILIASVYERDSQTAMARTFGSILAQGGSVRDVLDWPQTVKSVTADHVNQMARQYLHEHRSVTGYLRPAEAVLDEANITGENNAGQKDG